MSIDENKARARGRTHVRVDVMIELMSGRALAAGLLMHSAAPRGAGGPCPFPDTILLE